MDDDAAAEAAAAAAAAEEDGPPDGGPAGRPRSASPVPRHPTGVRGRAVRVACGGYHTVVLYESGDVVCFGSNSCGQCRASLGRYA